MPESRPLFSQNVSFYLWIFDRVRNASLSGYEKSKYILVLKYNFACTMFPSRISYENVSHTRKMIV